MRRSELLALAASAVIPAPAVRILVLGDSLALATGASRADGGFIFPAFRDLLRRRPGSRLDNLAIGGSTAADVLRLQVGAVRARDPDVIVVCVGGNDVVRGIPAATFAHTYARLLAGLRRAAPRARIVCCGVPNVAVSPLFADERTAVEALSRADDRAVRAAAAQTGARYVDFFALTSRRAGNASRFFSHDRFHPSDAGYALLRAAFAPALDAAVAV